MGHIENLDKINYVYMYVLVHTCCLDLFRKLWEFQVARILLIEIIRLAIMSTFLQTYVVIVSIMGSTEFIHLSILCIVMIFGFGIFDL